MTKQLPDVTDNLIYTPALMDPADPMGCWVYSDSSDILAIQDPRNAVFLPEDWSADHAKACKDFFESFPIVLVLGANEEKRSETANAIQNAAPGVPVCTTPQSAYQGFQSLQDMFYAMGAVLFSAYLRDEIWQDSEELPVEGLLEISTVEQVDIARQSKARSGIPDLDKRIGGLYDGEVSLWTGKRKEGKSTLLGLPILAAIREGRTVCVYSGELPAWRYKAWLLAMAAGPDHLTCSVTDTGTEVWSPKPEIARQIELWWKGKLWIIDNTVADVHDPDRIIALLTLAHRRYHASTFVVDNLMTVDLTGDDYYRAQSRFMGRLVDLAHVTGAHVHLVAHRRKGGADKKGRGDNDDVSGSGDLTNRPDNVFGVSRMDAVEDYPYEAKLEVQANRTFGYTGEIGLHFDPKSRRYYIHNPNWLCGWETGEALPGAEQASLFRGSGAIGGPDGDGNRNAATVVIDHQVQFTELIGADADTPFT